MPVNEANNEREQINPAGAENVGSRNELTTNRNILTNSNTSQTSANPSSSLDEEVIRRRGKRERKYNIVTRSMDPRVLATRKSPVKRPRSNSATLDIIKMFADLQKSPAKTPVKRQRTSPPSSPGVMTRKRLNMSCDSGIGSASSSPSSTNGTRSAISKKSISVIKARRSRRNLRRLS